MVSRGDFEKPCSERKSNSSRCGVTDWAETTGLLGIGTALPCQLFEVVQTSTNFVDFAKSFHFCFFPILMETWVEIPSVLAPILQSPVQSDVHEIKMCEKCFFERSRRLWPKCYTTLHSASRAGVRNWVKVRSHTALALCFPFVKKKVKPRRGWEEKFLYERFHNPSGTFKHLYVNRHCSVVPIECSSQRAILHYLTEAESPGF